PFRCARRPAAPSRPSGSRPPTRPDAAGAGAPRPPQRREPAPYLLCSTSIGSVRWLAAGSLVRPLVAVSFAPLPRDGAPGPALALPPPWGCVGTVPLASSRQVTISTLEG